MNKTPRQWIVDRCTTGKGVTDLHANLFASWKSYALQAGEEPGNARRFTAAIVRLGYQPIRDEGDLRSDGIAARNTRSGIAGRRSDFEP